jgi:hypothetical protein
MEWNGLIQAKIASIVDLGTVPNNNNRKNNFQFSRQNRKSLMQPM